MSDEFESSWGWRQPASPAHTRILAMCFFALVAVVILTLIGGDGVYALWTKQTFTITVKDKERVVEGSGDNIVSRYLIFTEEHDVLEDVDTVWYRKFDSSSLYGKLDRGHTYTVEVYGWRWPFWSMYPNIIRIVQ
jgi:hypothetical protein